MAQIEQSDKGGKKKKGAQKKMPIHVDFTPMVDMNMLLITFFMLCTTMLKPQTLKIALPTNDKVSDSQKNQAADDKAITILLDVERDANGEPVKDAFGNTKTKIYYYFKNLNPDEGVEQLHEEQFLGNEGDVRRGIRDILYKRNKEIVDAVNDLKAKWRKNEITEEQFKEEAKKIRNDEKLYQIVMIKPTPEAPWESVINALDEMNIAEIVHFQLENLNDQERKLLGLPVESDNTTDGEGSSAPAGN